jgi:hypothetical protein
MALERFDVRSLATAASLVLSLTLPASAADVTLAEIGATIFLQPEWSELKPVQKLSETASGRSYRLPNEPGLPNPVLLIFTFMTRCRADCVIVHQSLLKSMFNQEFVKTELVVGQTTSGRMDKNGAFVVEETNNVDKLALGAPKAGRSVVRFQQKSGATDVDFLVGVEPAAEGTIGTAFIYPATQKQALNPKIVQILKSIPD